MVLGEYPYPEATQYEYYVFSSRERAWPFRPLASPPPEWRKARVGTEAATSCVMRRVFLRLEENNTSPQLAGLPMSQKKVSFSGATVPCLELVLQLAVGRL